MKRFLLVSSVASSILIGNLSAQENTLIDMFKNGKVSGNVRAAYINYSYDANDEKAFGAGAKLHYETDSSKVLTFGTTFYTTNTLGVSPKDPNEVAGDFFSSKKKSYSILGEAYVQANFPGTVVKVGRQELATPLADSDDASIIPNTFEGVVAINTALSDITLIGGYVTKMSGWDSADKPEKFVGMHKAAVSALGEDDGVGVAAMVFTGVPNLTFQVWDYYVTDLLNAIYTEALYETTVSDISLGAGAQYQAQDEVGDKVAGVVDGNMYGVKGTLGYVPSGTTLTLAYNEGNKQDIIEAWGGGPMYVSLEELGSVGSGTNSKSYMVGLDQSFEALGAKGLSAFAYYGTMEADNNYEQSEFDFGLTYEFDSLVLEGIAAFITDDNDKTAEYDKYFVRATYNF